MNTISGELLELAWIVLFSILIVAKVQMIGLTFGKIL